MNQINVGLIGFGIVGGGLAQIFYEHPRRLDDCLGRPIRLTRIADLDIATDRGVKVPEGVLTNSADAVLDDPDIHVVVELIGGLEPARGFILRAIEAGKHVVTANKALLAHHGNEIFSRADARGVGVFFEAAVAGGIPIIRSVREGLAANRTLSLYAILNGTCNYILTRMTDNDEEFSEVLRAAQQQGLAEADPTLDVEGVDTAHKLAILLSLCFGGPIQFDKISVEGISQIEAADIGYAREFGYVIKLLAIARRVGEAVEARVHPAMIPRQSMLAAVKGAFNAIHINAEPVGEVLFYGLGAGRKPTASAVAGDVIEAARDILSGVGLRVPLLGRTGSIERKLDLVPIDAHLTRHYLRLNALDKPGVLSRVSGVLAENNISIESVIQKGRGESHVPIVMITHHAREADFSAAVNRLAAADVLRGRPVRLRIEENP